MPRNRTLTSILTSTALLAGITVLVSPASTVSALPAPVAQVAPGTVSATNLPTVQIDGVAWSQEVSGDSVYVAGKFANARPAGAPPGTNLTTRNNMLSYDITTGMLNTAFAPNLNNQAYVVKASPDGSRIYVGGEFTLANGVQRNRLAAYNTATGQLVATFAPNLDFIVRAIEVTDSAVYVGGSFSSGNGVARSRLAAFSPVDGSLLNWDPNANDTVNAMVLTPDGSKLIVGGRFTTIGGVTRNGLAALDPVTGVPLPWAINNTIYNHGDAAAILSLDADSTAVYGTGYVFGNVNDGNLEGTFSADPTTGAVKWIQNCHGDHYGVWSSGAAVYTVSHAHYCTPVGGFPQSDPWAINMRHAIAFSPQATGTNGRDEYAGGTYYNFEGTPSPTMYNWFPDFTPGSFTGQTQAAWAVSGNSQYVVMGGEFPRVNNIDQEGLVRFKVPGTGERSNPPQITGAAFVPSVAGVSAGKIRVAWQANLDRDDLTLTYKLVRNGQVNTPIYTTTANSTFWKRPTLGFFDSDVVPGETYTYRVYVVDASGNSIAGNPVSIVAPDNTSLSAYDQFMAGQGAQPYWSLSGATGPVAIDSVGFDDGSAGSGVVRGVTGSVIGESSTAVTLDGTSSGVITTQTPINGPNVFSVSAWFRTTTTSGGKIIGFGNSNTGLSGNYDRHVYMDNSGRIWFGVHPGAVRTLNSTASYNDGQWHQVVASLGADGMRLSVDGRPVASRTDVTVGQAYTGYWRVGGDNLNGWTSAPASPYFAGDIDNVAFFNKVLDRGAIRSQYLASGRTLSPSAPADAYGAAIYNDDPDIYWRLGQTSGTSATDSGSYLDPGTINNGVTWAQAGAVIGTADTAARFNGSNGLSVSKKSQVNPRVYTTEAWFKTTSTSGGRIIGFGSSNGSSDTAFSNRSNNNQSDRHVYMQNSGRLVFGTNTGTTSQAVSPLTYNDNQWHFVAASQGPDGMKLYVDGTLVATHAQTTPSSYTGYWRVGGDRLPVSGTGPTNAISEYLNATIDEAAVYSKVLTATQIAQHYTLGSGNAANLAPTATFGTSVGGLTGSFDASASSDPDGSIATYQWNFGDGTATTAPSASPTISRPYTKAGTFTVTLTVTDGGNASATTTRNVVTIDNYGVSVAANSPSMFWRLDDASGTVARDWSGNNRNGTYTNSPTLNVAGSTVGTTHTATQFDGTNDFVVSPQAGPAPSVYSQEVWFKTVNNTTGGKLIGFGTSSSSTASTNHDRNIYMDSTGTVRFGVRNAQIDAIASAAGYNDGQWHQAVATQGPDGMKLYMDGALVASNSITTAQTMSSGFWRVGGDATWQGATYFRGVIANVSVYPTVLSSDAVGVHYRANLNLAPPNQFPVASFTETATGLAVSVDGSASSDPDGTIASYAWDFGGVATATGATASHTFAAPGTYSIALTVTDDDGGSTTTTHPVTVDTINQLPTAAFTSVADDLDVGFDASTSSDPDGTVVSYAWDFGDSSAPGSGATVNHVYSAGGTYTVSLTVTDNRGGTNTTTSQVTVNAPPTAAFTTAHSGLTIDFDAGTSADSDGTITDYAWNFGDGNVGSGATVQHAYLTEGTFVVTLIVTDDDGATTQTTDNVAVVIPNEVPTSVFTTSITDLAVGFDGSTSSDADGNIVSYAWTFGDGGTSDEATPSHTYTAGGSYSVTLTVTDDDGGTGVSTQTVNVLPANVNPTASFTASTSFLIVSVNGSASSDPDGTITGYLWNFGDGATETTSAANHTYTAAGTYNVSLTVTDNRGGTATTVQDVTVSAPVSAVTLAADDFGRTQATGFGTADTGGAWTSTSAASNFSVSAGAGRIRMGAAGAGPAIYLNSLSARDLNAVVDVTLDKAATGAGAYISLAARRVGTSEYRARIKYIAGGTAQLYIGRILNGTETTLRSVNLTGLTVNPGDVLRLRFEVSGTGTATLNAKAWLASGTEPTAWQNTITDASPQLNVAGGIGVIPYISGTVTNAPVVAIIDNLKVTTIGDGPANQLPAAAFTSSATFLAASFNGAGSSDPDGTIASYAWNFGDATSGTGATPSHTYAAAGTYNVTLTVTDNNGGTGQVSHPITVAAEPPNQNPVAAFTSSNTDLQAGFDAATSTDADGTISAYAWNFGDSTTGTGVTTTHAYAAAGTYAVTLTVTDDRGATNSTTSNITVTAPVGPVTLAADNFGRSLATGFGTADTGGAWTTSGSAANWSVSAGAGRIRMATAGSGPSGYLNSVSARDVNAVVDVTLDKPATGGGVFVSLAARRVGTSEYRARIKYIADGTVQVTIGRILNGTETTLRSVNVPGLTVNPGDVLRLRFDVTGTGTATLNAKVWLANAAEPASWQNTITDASPQLDVAGAVGVIPYVTGSATNAPIIAIIDNLKVTSSAPVLPNVNPVAGFTSSVSTWTATFDSSSSSDSDGTIVGYAWNFGDGATSTLANPSRTYAANATYTVTLTVTDDRGGTHTITHPVVINVPNQLPVAGFTSTVSNLQTTFTSTSTDPDGTIVGYSWSFGDGDTATTANTSHTYLIDGTYNVTLTVTDNRGGTATIDHDVTVSAPVGVITVAADNFGRTTSGGLGNADTGGAWTTGGGPSNFSVSAGAGRIRMSSAGSGPSAYLNSVSARDVNAVVDVTLDKPATGGGVFVSLAARRVGTSEYRARIKYIADGTVQLTIGRILNGTETTLRSVNVPGLTVNPGDVLRLRFDVTGTGTATLNAKVWLANAAEPASWQNTITDASPQLDVAGGVGILPYLSGSATNAPIIAIVDNLNVTTHA